jgi:uncharacterized phage protein (TIGR01671 family)
MSREIKFRAWVFDDESGKRKMIAANQIKLCGDFAYVYCAEDDYEYQINTPDLSQFTGLRDKRGVEIYEGDVVTDRGGKIKYIEWLDEGAGFIVRDKSGDDWWAPNCDYVGSYITVIGNLYENQELLKP